MIRYFIPLLVLLFVSLGQSIAQETDTIIQTTKADTSIVKKKHSPFKATIMSVALPGLGQVYNGKWWKVPIIYGGFGGLIYSSVFNDLKCRTYKEAYLIRIDDNPATTDEFVGQYSDANLKELVSFYQRNRDLSLVFTGVLYALNIIDASVDAHLKDFDVSDDLTLKVRPTMHQIGPGMIPAPALALTLRLR
ncbi:MAG: hypothetical protein K9G41_11860 [Flavobacteriales bacterium]|nr:hypothetical protein [Flavobacteriales bacterium]